MGVAGELGHSPLHQEEHQNHLDRDASRVSSSFPSSLSFSPCSSSSPVDKTSVTVVRIANQHTWTYKICTKFRDTENIDRQAFGLVGLALQLSKQPVNYCTSLALVLASQVYTVANLFPLSSLNGVATA